MKEIKVYAPATVANVACGFDILGFAVNHPGDTVMLKLVDEPGVVIKSIKGDQGRLPKDPTNNTAGVVVLDMIKDLKINQGVEIHLEKGLPLGSGFGSSAASSVASAFALNELLGRPYTLDQLLPFCMEGERLACGSAHADNVAPALYGGFVLIRSTAPLDVISIETPELWVSMINPHIEIRTEDSRNVLKKEIPLSDAITQWGNIAGLITGLHQSNYELIGRSLQDVIIEPTRSLLIPGFKQVKAAALEAGALGASLSGSGPSLFALSQTEEHAKKISTAMQMAFQKVGLDSDIYTSSINLNGPQVL